MEIVTPEKALVKMYKYCAYQERCQHEVNEKLFAMGINQEIRDQIIVRLIEENFINEERFAKAYCRGKFRMNEWGRIKIKLGLKQHHISDYCIKKGMAEIDSAEYSMMISKLVKMKNKIVKESNQLIRIKKIQQYLASKGFEHDLVMNEIRVQIERN